ncbi:MAG: hypothetical protein NZO16_04870 [Deltaproteobacteria bacterium]|nr:hypothetical protein [Deltaproteobacteria bacterium]
MILVDFCPNDLKVFFNGEVFRMDVEQSNLDLISLFSNLCKLIRTVASNHQEIDIILSLSEAFKLAGFDNRDETICFFHTNDLMDLRIVLTQDFFSELFNRCQMLGLLLRMVSWRELYYLNLLRQASFSCYLIVLKDYFFVGSTESDKFIFCSKISSPLVSEILLNEFNETNIFVFDANEKHQIAKLIERRGKKCYFLTSFLKQVKLN